MTHSGQTRRHEDRLEQSTLLLPASEPDRIIQYSMTEIFDQLGSSPGDRQVAPYNSG